MAFRFLPVNPLRRFSLAIAPAVVAIAPAATRVSGQVLLPDATLDTQVQQSNSGFTVTGGTLRGQNLFHSFDTFSPQTQSVLFDLTATGELGQGIERIFSRVTGPQTSHINGLLQTEGETVQTYFCSTPTALSLVPMLA